MKSQLHSAVRLTCAVSAIVTLAALAASAQPTSPATGPTTASTRPAIGQAVTTETGLIYHFTQLGTGPSPKQGDTLVIHGIGRFTDGKEFWNTRTDNSPYQYKFGVDRVIAGFSEGMRHVRQGDRIVITMKPELAYGQRERGNIPANSTLVFDYEILEIKPTPATQPAGG